MRPSSVSGSGVQRGEVAARVGREGSLRSAGRRGRPVRAGGCREHCQRRQCGWPASRGRWAWGKPPQPCTPPEGSAAGTAEACRGHLLGLSLHHVQALPSLLPCQGHKLTCQLHLVEGVWRREHGVWSMGD